MFAKSHWALRFCFAVVVFALGACRFPAFGQAVPSLESVAPGLSLRFDSVKEKIADARSARLFALNVPVGNSPTPFLTPGPFTATFEGFIEQRIRSDYQFSASGNGTLKVTINDKPALDGDGDLTAAMGDKVTLKKGKNKIVVVYKSPNEGDAIVRLYWAGDDFPAEPIDPKLLTHSIANPTLETGLQLREGRSLFANLHCLKCHADGSLSNLKEGMPELAKDAPNLDDVGARLKPAWLARWISNPKAMRPDTSMPNLFHGKAGSTVQEGADIAAYLATLGGGTVDDEKAPAADAVTAGGRIVARLGCIGCHTLPDRNVGVDAERVPWQFVKAKYKAAGLVEFLKQPEKHFAWIRMPNFRLSDNDAKNVAAYLLTASQELEGNAPPGDAVRGKQLVQLSGCVNCHGMKLDNPHKSPALDAIAKNGWEKGCLAKDEAARGKAPQFDLDDAQRAALRAFAATDHASLKHDNQVEFAARQMTELRCVACHTRDNKQDVWDDLVKETEGLSKGDAVDPESSGGGGPKALPGEPAPGTGDQSRPQLTWTGEKLYPEWMSRFIAGKMDYKPRAWMPARMPGFPARALGLANGMVLEHGYPTTNPERPEADAEAATTGKQLVGRNGGFSCIQCHGIATVAPVSPFEAPAINFKYLAERVQKEYYDRWMRNPARIVPTTKMPAFADADGKTALRDILEGDAPKQFDAIWNYLMAGRKIEHPEQEPANP